MRRDGRCRSWICFAARGGGQKNWPLVLPWAPWRRRAQTSRRVRETGPARAGPVAGPALVSPAYQDNKLEDVEGLPGGRLRTAHPIPTVQSGINSWKYPSTGPRPSLSGPPEMPRPVLPRAGSGTEPAMPRGVRPQRAEEVHPPESRPVGVAEVELRVDALPQQEAAQPLLPRGADHQVRVGLSGRVQVVGDVLHVQDLGQLLDAGPLGRVVVQQRPYRVGDLPPPAVADGHVDQQPWVVRRGLGG